MLSRLLTFFLCIAAVRGFVPPTSFYSDTSLYMSENKRSVVNPLQELGDMFSSMDDVIDDFFNKRMGNGEIFYGKRKFKPSGKVEGQYNGMGMTDKQRIEDTRELKEMFLQRKRVAENSKKRP